MPQNVDLRRPKTKQDYKHNPATTIDKNTEERGKIADSTGDTKRHMRERERERAGRRRA
jgi:hypothetical protein